MQCALSCRNTFGGMILLATCRPPTPKRGELVVVVVFVCSGMVIPVGQRMANDCSSREHKGTPVATCKRGLFFPYVTDFAFSLFRNRRTTGPVILNHDAILPHDDWISRQGLVHGYRRVFPSLYQRLTCPWTVGREKGKSLLGQLCVGRSHKISDQ